MKNVLSIFKRELKSYFLTPVAYVFIVFFLLLTGFFTFKLGGLYERGQADLAPFFAWHPWIYLFFLPAVSMRLWAEERKTGTIELLMTLPVTVPQAVIGKFLAAWVFAGCALALTFPTWITINYLGNPDNLAILAGYIGSFLMAGAFIAVGSAISALTKNQVIAFVVSAVVCVAFVLVGFPPVVSAFPDWVPDLLVEALASLSFFTHFDTLSKGLIEARNLVFFASLIALCLFANTVILEAKKAD